MAGGTEFRTFNRNGSGWGYVQADDGSLSGNYSFRWRCDGGFLRDETNGTLSQVIVGPELILLDGVPWQRASAGQPPPAPPPATPTATPLPPLPPPPPPVAQDPAWQDAYGLVRLPAAVRTGGQRLNLRVGPGTDYRVITQVANRTPVFVLGRAAGAPWLVIEGPRGLTGWVFQTYIALDRPVEALPVVPFGPPPPDAPAPPPTAVPTAAPQPPQPTGFYRTSVRVYCDDASRVWFDGSVTDRGRAVNGARVVFKSRLVAGNEPVTAPAFSGPGTNHPDWPNGYYAHIVDADADDAQPKHLEIWVQDAWGNRISDYAYWDTDGRAGRCNRARVDFFVP